MILFRASIFVLFVLSFIHAQDATKVAIIKENGYELIDADNQSGTLYISINDLTESLMISLIKRAEQNTYSLNFDNYAIKFSENNPFVSISNLKDNTVKSIQLISSPYFKNGELFIISHSLVEIINLYWDKELLQLAPNRIRVIKKLSENNVSVIQLSRLINIKIESNDDNSLISLISDIKVPSAYNFYRGNKLHVMLWGTYTLRDSIIYTESDEIIKQIELINTSDYLEFIISLKENETIAEMYQGKSENELLLRISERDFGDWFTRESDNFKIIYRDAHSHLVAHILSSAENSLKQLQTIFDYKPNDKILINTYDVSDYGFGATTTLPENYVRLEIEPMEPGYEVVPYSERFQWLISHELVHIIVNDKASDFENSLRSIFGKVNPEKQQPLTVFYSLLTNHNRYTPRWYQEAIAVFIETWFSGGYGRVLGSFDEMYFRTLVNDGLKFPGIGELEIVTSHKSIFLENIFYLYGTRFISHLAEKYGARKIYDWFSSKPREFYPGVESKFEEIFNTEFYEAWNEFVINETSFQQANLFLLQKASLTESKPITPNPLGWVTQTTYDSKTKSLIFGHHQSGKLAEIVKYNIEDGKLENMITLPSPSIIQVASVTYDENYKQLFYTTNNNQLYRDLWVYDLNTKKDKILFRDYRVGAITISPNKHELWGIQHHSGKATLVRSKYPYTELQSLYVFDVGDEFQDLSVNRNGNFLAATLHRSDGKQSIILIDLENLEKSRQFQYKTITSIGSPENPSWSIDGNFIYWNSYTNGVSNIFKYNISTEEITAITNTLKGLFRPVEISKDSLVAMEFYVDGFLPVKIGINKAERLPAINYFGQKILDKEPELYNYILKPAGDVVDKSKFTSEESLSAFDLFSVKTFIPVVSGFQSRVVLGIYTQLNDALFTNDLVVETGISPFKETTNDIKGHLRLKYSYKQKLIIAAEYNAPDFYDLFNKRKRGMLGSRFAVGYTNYLVYDNPLKVRQNTELSYYNGIKFINDNLTEVKVPDYLILKSELDIRDLRRTIGSIDWESGDWIRLSVLGYASDPDDPKYSGQLMGEWDKYFITLFDHNVLHLKLTSGYQLGTEDLPETKFYFGGFGNREIENEPVKQFEKMFRFPGVPIYSIVNQKFVKVIVENSFPVIRIGGIEFTSIALKNINVSVFSQGLYSDSPTINKIVDVGGQINIMFEHWANLESTFSAGIAKAWWQTGNDYEWFISYKLLKD